MYLVLVPALVLTFALDRAGLTLFAGLVDTADPGNAWVNPDSIRDRLNTPVVLGNLFFLQAIFVPTLGSNAPLWSLANEGWYYVIFPCLWLAFTGRSGWQRQLFHGGLGAAALVMVGWSIALYFIVWLLGTAVCLLRLARPGPNHRRFRPNGVAGLALVLAVLVGTIKLRWRHPELWFAIDLALGLAVAVLLYGLLDDDRPKQTGAYGWFAKTVAGFSFTLYAVHLPILAFTRLCLSPAHRWQPDGRHVVLWWLIVGGVLVGAYALSRLTEAHTDALRRAVLGSVSPRRSDDVKLIL